ncbi:glycosyltransferase (plasmid) [Methylobacterium phyllosphaerae]
MRIVILSYGSRGDVQPQLGLALGLRDLGHDVVIGAPENLRSFVEKAGIAYAKLPGDSLAILQSDQGKLWLSSGDVRAFFKEVAAISHKVMPEICRSALSITAGSDAIIGGTFCEDIAVTLAEHYGKPVCLLHASPHEQTRSFPDPLVTRANLPFGFLNLLTYKLAARLGWNILEPTLNPFRASLSLPPWSSSVLSRSSSTGILTIQMWSQTIVPHAADLPRHVHTSGFVHLPKEARRSLGESTPPAHLTDWLARGQPPVYLGFGSMPVNDPAGLTRTIMKVADQLGVRMVVSAGWAGLGAAQEQVSDRLCFIQNIDHSWLLPQCAAAVHHGGAGTTAATLTAGIPALVCSVFADQPFWGERLRRLGIGAHVPFSALNKVTLASGIRTVLAEGVRMRAAEFGAKLRVEDGNAVALRALSGWLARAPHQQIGRVKKAA